MKRFPEFQSLSGDSMKRYECKLTHPTKDFDGSFLMSYYTRQLYVGKEKNQEVHMHCEDNTSVLSYVVLRMAGGFRYIERTVPYIWQTTSFHEEVGVVSGKIIFDVFREEPLKADLFIIDKALEIFEAHI